MILGAILRNYKCYSGTHYIPFYKEREQNLNVIIGDNGVGKSTILEALDSLFNEGTPWIVNSDSPSHESSVGALFLIEKDKCNSVLNTTEQNILSTISDAMWSLDPKSNSTYEKNYSALFEQRKSLIKKKDTHYFFAIGKRYNEHTFSIPSSFDNYISEAIKILSIDTTDSSVTNTLNKTIGIYSYLYIPVETTISDFLRLETAGMQVLADKNLKGAISDALTDRLITKTTERNRTKKVSVLDIINERLEDYIEQIQNEIQKIDKSYDFKPEYRQTTKLTPNHIANVVIDAYYSRRKLKMNKKPISTLSSGEKRRALIDIIYVFLSKNEIDRNLVLAIDEPESSLHISKCYDQFRKVQDIATKYNQQLFITTHWYGSLPILKSGNLMHIDHDQEITLFDLENYFEQRGNHPNDINLKSFFDLAAAIISAYRNSNCHWLLVEGVEDKLYLQYYLDSKNIQILPLSGCGNVKKVYEYLFTPVSNSKQELPNKKEPKILCLVDTDSLNSQLNVDSKTKNKQLQIRRWNENTTTHEIELKTIEDPNITQTEIEEILEPAIFYNTLKTCIANFGNDDEKDAFNAFEYDENVLTSRIKGDYSILNHLGNGRNMRHDKELINAFVDRMKHEIASTYIQSPKTGNNPSWVGLINDILNN
ncbi:MAG: AAA family ATPase [Bacteroidales bacterium]|nr:AAA family ATPase [Bacteroidales bacterium]MBR4715728.1 AAA family ATPase [Bacteroidales bacterium]